jgi:hypothetical protein
MSDQSNVTLCGRSLGQPGHICAFFDSRDEQYDILAPFYREGLDQGEQVINIVDRDCEGSHFAHLIRRGIDADEAIASGSLKVFAAEETYVVGGSFAAERMYDLLQGALASARRSGWRVRATGVMDWSQRGYPGTGELLEYEARVNVLVPIYDCTLLCVYDMDRLDARTMMDVLATHPYVIYRQQILQNPYYRPPLEVLRDMLVHDGPTRRAAFAAAAHSSVRTQAGVHATAT